MRTALSLHSDDEREDRDLLARLYAIRTLQNKMDIQLDLSNQKVRTVRIMQVGM